MIDRTFFKTHANQSTIEEHEHLWCAQWEPLFHNGYRLAYLSCTTLV
jgi:hypothetical protein